MKTIIQRLLLILLVLAPFAGAKAIGIDNRTCDTNITPITLRVGHSGESFPDTLFQKKVENPAFTYVYIPRKEEYKSALYIKENYGDDINGDGKSLIDSSTVGNFVRTTRFRDETKADSNIEYVMGLPVNSTITYRDAIKYAKGYNIVNPPKERKTDNLTVVYTLGFRDYVGGNVGWGSTRYHTECLSVSISSCGDGVVDSGDGETCDDGNNVSGDGCSATCQAEPVCNSVSLIKSTTDRSALVECFGANNSTYKIDCGNGTTIDAKTGTCTYDSDQEFNVTCSVDGNITSDSCQTSVDFGDGGGGGDAVCTGVTAVVSSSNDREFNVTCTGNNAESFSIDCGNGQTLDSSTGTCVYASTGDFQINCTINGDVTSDACNTTARITSGGGGGSDPACSSTNISRIGETNDYKVTCFGSKANTYSISCGDGTTVETTTGEATCSYPSKGTFAVECVVNGEFTSDSCNKDIVVEGDGDGGGGDGGGGDGGGGDGGDEDKDGPSEPAISNPEEVDILFAPKDTVILGFNEIVFNEANLSDPRVTNNTGTSIKLADKLCVYNVSNGVVEGTYYCDDEPVGVLEPGASKTIPRSSITNFVTKNHGDPFQEAKLKVTLEGYQDNPNVGSEIKVIVSAPTITNVGGGTAYGRYFGVSNLEVLGNKVSYSIASKNKNFVTTHIGASDTLSGYNGVRVDSPERVDGARKDKDSDVFKFASITTEGTKSGFKNPDDITTSFNGIENTYHLKNKDLVITATSLPKPGSTYVVEGGDIIINGDIDYAGDLSALVVKGGNIVISNNVKKIKGVLISIDGEIKGGSDSTKNSLTILGALYGDMKDLISKRIRIDYDSSTSLINVGTVINFDSDLFISPPPLLGTFVKEYIEIKKVAQ